MDAEASGMAQMRIAIFDPYLPRFSQGFMDKWLEQGHEVRRDRYYDPELVKWADVVWFETCDNNLHVATHGMSDHPDWDMHTMDLTGKKVVVRVIDIEAWYGHHLNVKWDVVTDVIFIAPHIRQLVEKEVDFSHLNVYEIPCGVDIEQYDFVDKPIGKKIAWVCEKWPTKGIDYALQIMAMLPKDYELHTIGGWNDRYAWEKEYQEDFIERNGIKFFDHEWVEDQNEWLADKDFILSCSKKEAFGYNIAEGMSKGLIPVIHHFYGAEHLWPKLTWDTVDVAVDLISYTPISDDADIVRRIRRSQRQYLIDHGYTLDAMVDSFNKVLDS